MRILTAFFANGDWIPAELEVALLPGIAGLHVLGPVKRELRECLPKMKAAFRAQGFQWPRTQHVVVYVHSNAPVSGQLLELPMALGVLNLTRQISISNSTTLRAFGELLLDGTIRPLDIPLRPPFKNEKHVFGPHGIDGYVVSSLRDLQSPQFKKTFQEPLWRRPPVSEKKYPESIAKMIATIAHGEHPTLLAGPPGTGKSTVMDSIYEALPEISEEKKQQVFASAQPIPNEVVWRPKISPHHSASSLAIVGGGNPPRAGEISKAHGGVLILDEYLQFKSNVQEALREPVERGELRLSRGPNAVCLPSDFLLIAATNLCPCGRKAPGVPTRCGRALYKCESHLQKLSGPMLDRFQVVSLSHVWRKERTHSMDWIVERVRVGQAIKSQRRQTLVNARLARSEILETFAEDFPYSILASGASERRDTALLRVARSLADIAGSEYIQFEHLSEARQLATEPHFELEQNML